jgi:hypothetical protein
MMKTRSLLQNFSALAGRAGYAYVRDLAPGIHRIVTSKDSE